MAINFSKIGLSKSVVKNGLLNASAILLLYLLFNIFTLNIISFYLNKVLDLRLEHELEKVLRSVSFNGGQFEILDWSEFLEKDFNELTENPFMLQIYDLEKNELLSSNNIKLYGQINKELPNFSSRYYFEDSQDSDLRTAYEFIFDEENSAAAIIQLSTTKSSFNEILNRIIIINLSALPFIALISLIISLFISRKTFEPVNKIISLAQRIGAMNLKERLDFKASPNDEMGKLRDTLNNLFDRLETHINEISYFSDNASHQLMTPLTALKTEIEYLLKQQAPGGLYAGSLDVLREQTDRMIKIVRSLLMLSKDPTLLSGSNTIFNLSAAVTAFSEKLSDRKGLSVNVSSNKYIKGSQEYFMIVLENLIDNAFKYCDENCEVKLELFEKEEAVVLSVSDNGIGIADSEKDRIFQRFYRSDTAEKRGIKGYGLGLSLVQTIIKGMNGEISLRRNIPQGTVFEIKFPKVELI